MVKLRRHKNGSVVTMTTEALLLAEEDHGMSTLTLFTPYFLNIWRSFGALTPLQMHFRHEYQLLQLLHVRRAEASTWHNMTLTSTLSANTSSPDLSLHQQIKAKLNLAAEELLILQLVIIHMIDSSADYLHCYLSVNIITTSCSSKWSLQTAS